ncbi:hypothetical protein [Companilactobacillus insicii]|uniref:hypothetical protein n=1 Tax=Companilactobacillus insicii TaxID=1732567 RepID=UPI000F78ABC9|nr:hypothetical protein [Companilactobacillus insicii]
MSNNKLKFNVDIGVTNNVVSNNIHAGSAPKLIMNKDHLNSNLNVRNLDAKVYFMSNCGKSIDLKDFKFLNYITSNDYITKNCLEYLIENPKIISKNSTYIRINSNNRNRIQMILSNYLNKSVLDEYEDSFRETPIVSDSNIPLFHKGRFRVFTLYNYDKIEGNILYVIFYDPYHLIFSNEKNYHSQKNSMRDGFTSINDKFHDSVDAKLIKSFDALV